MIRIRPLLSCAFIRPRASVVKPSYTRFASTRQRRSQNELPQENELTATQLQSLETYPLARSLTSNVVTHKIGADRGLSAHVRPQIVSPDLCDDVMKYIGPTLDKHKGCDILDINPGAGLWSQKLHDYLKPRSHVLLEPRHDKFKEFLDPLLKAPGSKYKILQKDPCDLCTYQNIITEGIFPHQAIHRPDDPKAQQANNTFLVTGSLVWEPRLLGMGFDSMAKQLFHHFTTGAWHNEYFHAFGLTRLLLWMQNDDFSPMIATSINSMHKANRFLEMTQNMNLVVNAERGERKTGRGSSGREPNYEFESIIRALKAGEAGGFRMPENRRAQSHAFATEVDSISGGTGIARVGPVQEYLHAQHIAGKPTAGFISTTLADLHNDELALAEKYPDVEWSVLSLLPSSEVRSRLKKHPNFDDFKPYLKKRSAMDGIRKKRLQVEACGDIGEAMYRIEGKILDMKDGSEKDSLRKELAELEKEWDTAYARIAKNIRPAVLNDTDDRISLRSPPHPRIQWDRRPFEPLAMRPNEVWPPNRLCLISTEPIPRGPVDAVHDHAEWVQDFVYGLFNMPAEPVNHALDRMQHSLSDIIKDCPSLTNPSKGGRLNMKHFRVRMLTVEMILELVAAYKKWPFKAPGSDYSKYYRHRGNVI